MRVGKMMYGSSATASAALAATSSQFVKSYSPTISNSTIPLIFSFHTPHIQLKHQTKPLFIVLSSSTLPSTRNLEEVLPPSLDSTSNPPPLFDGTTRLYISYTCPYAQRVWITRNCKGLQDKIKLVPIDLMNRPSWYKDKVYPPNKVPSLEHNNEVKGESLDLIKYIDSHFEGPSLLSSDPAKRDFADLLFSYTDSFSKAVTAAFKEEGVNAEADAAFDYIEDALSKFNDGPFFLGQFSLVDIAYGPFFERYIPFLLDVKKYDLMAGRPNIAVWFQEMNNIEGYKQTQTDPKELVEKYKKRYLAN